MTLPEFIRIYPLRAKNIAWFFGAGTSISSGLPSAYDLIWDFKRKIYCSEQGYPVSLFSNLTDSGIRNQIQSYFDSKENYPAQDSIEEYSFYFELAFPNKRDRSDFLSDQLSSMNLSLGHKVIGTLIKNELIKIVFTTNFDKAFENATIQYVPQMDNWLCATTDNVDTAVQKYHSGLRPMIVKLHGDYFSEKLKNTTDELKYQDSQLREILKHSCLSNGLGVMGYSGRDSSIMEVFDQALEQGICFPSGLFWFTMSGSEPLEPVQNLIAKAKSKGVQAEIIEIDSFDSAWADFAKGLEVLPSADVEALNSHKARLHVSNLPLKGNKLPYLRMNAVEIQTYPSIARLIKCSAGGTKEVRELIKVNKSNLIGIRKKVGIVGFGSDEEFERLFGNSGNFEKDIYHVQKREFNDDDTVLKGLISEALCKALIKNKPLIFRKRGNRYLILPNPKQLNDAVFTKLKFSLYREIYGKIPETEIDWIVACEVSIHMKQSNYFLVLNPTVLSGKSIVESEKKLVAPFIKEKVARWYNNSYDNILSAWIDILLGPDETTTVYAYDTDIIGYNASFRLKKKSPFSKSN